MDKNNNKFNGHKLGQLQENVYGNISQK